MTAMTQKLKELIARVETWPEVVQEEAIATLEALEEEFLVPYELSDDDRQAIDRGLRAAAEGRFTSDEQVEAVFSKYRRA